MVTANGIYGDVFNKKSSQLFEFKIMQAESHTISLAKKIPRFGHRTSNYVTKNPLTSVITISVSPTIGRV